MSSAPPQVISAVNALMDKWTEAIANNDIELLMSTWVDDDCMYIIPGQPTFKGRTAVHAALENIMNQMTAKAKEFGRGGTIKTRFNITGIVDPVTSGHSPELVTCCGEQIIAIPGQAEDVWHGILIAQRVHTETGAWKIRMISSSSTAVVNINN